VKEDAMGDVTPMMPPETWAALERLLGVARADTHQARYAAISSWRGGTPATLAALI